MARVAYEPWNPRGEAQDMVVMANTICREYRAQGFDLTLRQLYYQFVARGYIPNNQRSYKRLGDIVNRARLAGLLDWNYIVDRTRELKPVSHWRSPADVIDAAHQGYAIDKWSDQPTRVEVWVEKEALAGVIGSAAHARDVAYFSCRGYVSQSELYTAAQRHMRYIAKGQNVVVLHLGDHDPSGIDMTRDIRTRLELFTDQDWLNANVEEFGSDSVSLRALRASMDERCEGRRALEVRRIALNADQIEQYNPPPNPAKLTDSRSADYVEQYGDESWELDALDPTVLAGLINAEIDALIDPDAYYDRQVVETRDRDLLELASNNWDELTEVLEGMGRE